MKYLPFGFFLLTVGVLLFALDSQDPRKPTLLGTAFPSHNQPLLDEDKPHPTTKQVALYNVFASWCTPCIAELPSLEALRSDKLAVIGIAWSDKAEKLRPWLTRHGNPYDAIYLDDGSLGLALGMRGVPESYLVDADGIIRYRHMGAITEDNIAEITKQLKAIAP